MQDAGPDVGRQLGEGEVLQLGGQPLHADALGERGVDLHRLGRDPAPLVRVLDELQRPHVVQAVGQLHQQHPDVVRHREQQLAEVLGLRGLRGLQLELVELGDPVDQAGDDGAEQALDLVERGARVLDRVVEEGGRDRGRVEAEPGQDAGDLDRVVEIGVARGSQLGAVRLHGEDVGPVEQVLVGVRVVGLDALDQLVLAHERAARTGGRGLLLARRLRRDHDAQRLRHPPASPSLQVQRSRPPARSSAPQSSSAITSCSP